ncbi:MAG: DUF899 domain-containing protein [Jatrophihabitans sp.]
MNLPQVVSRAEWVQARKELLAREKQLTRQIDAVTADRRRLPMVLVDTPYAFEGPDGQVGLLELFDGRSQLIVQHVMWRFESDTGCPFCAASIEEISDGVLKHLHARDTSFALVARGPYASIERYRASQGWTIPWYSSNGSDFNYDYHVTLDESVTPAEYNYRSMDEYEQQVGYRLVGPGQSSEMPGLSCFVRDQDDSIYHTYTTYARGVDSLVSAYRFLDLTAMGRHEKWEEPKGRATKVWRTSPDFAS